MHIITSKGCFLNRYSHQNLPPPHLFWLILSYYHIANSTRLCFHPQLLRMIPLHVEDY